MWVSDASSRQKCTHLRSLTRSKEARDVHENEMNSHWQTCVRFDALCVTACHIEIHCVTHSFNHRRSWREKIEHFVQWKKIVSSCVRGSVILSRFQFEWLFPTSTQLTHSRDSLVFVPSTRTKLKLKTSINRRSGCVAHFRPDNCVSSAYTTFLVAVKITSKLTRRKHISLFGSTTQSTAFYFLIYFIALELSSPKTWAFHNVSQIR